jgi:hypothetical protein
MREFHCRSDNPIEFDTLAAQVRQSQINSGASQAECAALSYGPMFGYDPADLLAAALQNGLGLRWG